MPRKPLFIYSCASLSCPLHVLCTIYSPLKCDTVYLASIRLTGKLSGSTINTVEIPPGKHEPNGTINGRSCLGNLPNVGGKGSGITNSGDPVS